MKVAFIGTGPMGRPVTRNGCAAGFAPGAYNRAPLPPGEWEALGANVAGSAADSAAGAEVVVTTLPNGALMGEVPAFGLLHALAPAAC